jgi:hypothetical protein
MNFCQFEILLAQKFIQNAISCNVEMFSELTYGVAFVKNTILCSEIMSSTFLYLSSHVIYKMMMV